MVPVGTFLRVSKAELSRIIFFLDGSLFRNDNLGVTRKKFVADYQAGFVIQISSIQLALTWVERSDEFEEQLEPQQFAAFSVAAKL